MCYQTLIIIGRLTLGTTAYWTLRASALRSDMNLNNSYARKWTKSNCEVILKAAQLGPENLLYILHIYINSAYVQQEVTTILL